MWKVCVYNSYVYHDSAFSSVGATEVFSNNGSFNEKKSDMVAIF